MSRGDYYDGAEPTKPQCPRCGDAFLAEHGDRTHCGKCGFTEWA